ncbi:heparinase II/III family protein [Sphingomonas astaxanthinifaciens]|uniref:Heparinase II/III family protein n=1 Tax=Sphingomonas astaxanthinifaciens DSM 22298 TaxID=1123267 RepID=A0ABQ5Z3Y5_9SPHN|nr:heparinase II/III family protein [Sphingomonas astaxanthinifaciens]GLR46727.1 heparinase II/III family protein [Sphingomonas astaxanthinifaciens DSM 22298]
MSDRGALQRLATVPLLQRLASRGKPPLRLLGVARDHVIGSKARGEQLLAGRFFVGGEAVALDDLDWAAIDPSTSLGAELHGFSWLRDVAAAATRERGAALAEGLVGRWLVAHGSKVDPAWAPGLWGERLLFWLAFAPYILSRRDADYRSALLNTMARGARHLAAEADNAPPGLARITAWAGLTAACLLLSSGTSRLAKAEGGLSRALASAQFDDGGLMSRSPAEQARLVDRLGLLRAAYAAARQDFPQGFEDSGAAALAALHGVTMGDGTLSSWQGGNEGSRAALAALVEGCGFRARPLRQPRGWGYHRLSALGTILVIDAAPPPPRKLARIGSASTLAIELSDGQQKLVVNCGGPGDLTGTLPEGLAPALRTTAAHSTLTLADTNSTAILPDGSLGRGAEDVSVSRTEDNDASRLESAHDGYVRGFGLVHQRALSLGNDGKEVRGLDRLTPRGRRKIREDVPFAVRFHLAPGVEAVPTADGLGALIRSPGAPPWNFRCRGAQLDLEESVVVDGQGALRSTLQLVLVGEVSHLGAEIGWQFRRSS